MPNMQKIIKVFQQISANEREASLPVMICYGKVLSLSPFQVQIEQKLVLDKNFFIVKSGVTASSFKVGDILILLRNKGGQQYLILDKKGAL